MYVHVEPSGQLGRREESVDRFVLQIRLLFFGVFFRSCQVLETKPEHFREFAERLERQMSEMERREEEEEKKKSGVDLLSSSTPRVLVEKKASATSGETEEAKKGERRQEKEEDKMMTGRPSSFSSRNLIAVVGSLKAFEEASKNDPKLQFNLQQVMRSS